MGTRRLAIFIGLALTASLSASDHSKIIAIDPPEDGFFAKRLDCGGIIIKAPSAVSDAAMLEAKRRIDTLLRHLPDARRNMVKAGAELHIIGKDQVTSDLPEFRDFKGKPFDGKLTIDERTRGMGGRESSCGEENLLKLPTDRYNGRDICSHEFSHGLQGVGLPEEINAQFAAQLKKSVAAGKWVGAYAASNPFEFFAELTMWYFGTHGDLHMTGEKPGNGPEGLKKYDPEAFTLFDDLYSGRMKVGSIKWAELQPQDPEKTLANPKPERWGDNLLRIENKTRKTITLSSSAMTDGVPATRHIIAPGTAKVLEVTPLSVWIVQTDIDRVSFISTAKFGIAEIRERHARR